MIVKSPQCVFPNVQQGFTQFQKVACGATYASTINSHIK